mmetsp:Transcript_23267/g.51615  ORF Transcript_23267/g.51615 Transcript_23267/m.51615 type:complete len:153 (+) Transcript_23267:2018-2476(+)
MNEWKEKKKQEAKLKAVFPCILKIDPNCVFRRSDPIIMGVKIEKGVLHKGTPLCIKQIKEDKSEEIITLGTVISIEKNHKEIDTSREDEVAIKILPKGDVYCYGRHFTHTDQVVSKISRDSIDALKEHFRDEKYMNKADWALIVSLKKHLSV